METLANGTQLPERDKNRRFVYYINPAFQSWFIFAIITSGFIMTLGSFGVHFFFMMRVREAAQELDLPQDHFFLMYLERQNTLLWLYLSVLAVATLCLVGFWALIVSHRIVGPLKKMENELKKVAEGQPLRSIKFRQGDFFLEVATAYNLMVESLGSKQKSKPGNSNPTISQIIEKNTKTG